MEKDLSLLKYVKEPPDKLAEKTKSEILGLSSVNLYDVDWEKTFDYLHFSFKDPEDFDEYIKDDGTYDIKQIEKRLNDPTRYLNKSGEIDIEKIKRDFNTSNNPIFIKIAITNSASLDEKNKEELFKIFMDNLKKSLSHGGVPRFIELIKSLGPYLVDSIQIIEKELPKILQREYIFKTPSSINGNEEYYLREYLNKGYSPEEAKELAQETKEYGDFLLIWRQILEWGGLPMKKKEYGYKKTRRLLNVPSMSELNNSTEK